MRFAQPLVIRVFSSDISAWWQHDLPLSFCDGDHLDLKDLFRAHLPTRAFPVHLEFSHARDNASFFHAADQLAQLGAQMHQTPSFNTAYEDYLAHSQLVEARQQLLLDIVLERDKVAKSKKLLNMPNEIGAAFPVTHRIIQIHHLVLSPIMTPLVLHRII